MPHSRSFVSRNDLRQVTEWLLGYLLLGGIPRTYDRTVFDKLSKLWLTRSSRRIDIDHDLLAIRMKAVLGDGLSADDIRRMIVAAKIIALENRWACWRASHTAEWSVRTEVKGLEHATTALDRGHGIVFWGMTFCGTLFPKIALARAGIPLTQLSTTDHGASVPLTPFGRTFVAPAYCLSENRYLQDRIYIPDNGDTSYLRTIGRLLRSNGCIWIAGERRAKKPLCVDMLGRPASFPQGAPVLALRHKSALIPAYTERLGTFHYRVTLTSPIRFDETLSRAKGIEQAVQTFATLLGEQVTRQPSGWCWNYAWVFDYVNRSDTGVIV
jgi:lauroyl/myristoyl acyltransferase